MVKNENRNIDKEFFKTLKIKVLEGDYSVIKSKKFYPKAFANIKASDLYTVVMRKSKTSKKNILETNKSFKIVQFETIIPFNLIGFIAEIANTLAKENISILIISSFSTDHIIIEKKDLGKTLKTLMKLGVKM